MQQLIETNTHDTGTSASSAAFAARAQSYLSTAALLPAACVTFANEPISVLISEVFNNASMQTVLDELWSPVPSGLEDIASDFLARCEERSELDRLCDGVQSGDTSCFLSIATKYRNYEFPLNGNLSELVSEKKSANWYFHVMSGSFVEEELAEALYSVALIIRTIDASTGENKALIRRLMNKAASLDHHRAQIFLKMFQEKLL